MMGPPLEAEPKEGNKRTKQTELQIELRNTVSSAGENIFWVGIPVNNNFFLGGRKQTFEQMALFVYE